MIGTIFLIVFLGSVGIEAKEHGFMHMRKENAIAWFAKYGNKNHVGVKQEIDSELPTNFDGRQQWPGCIHPVLDQGDCGSCWAFASSESLSDRFCIYSNKEINVVLSPQNLLSCEEENWYCDMGSPPNYAWSYLQDTGITTLDCIPYVSGNGNVPACNDTCQDGTQGKLYLASNYSHVGSFLWPDEHVQEIMKAVMEGPVDATFSIYSDFDSYTGGVYEYQNGSFEGLHSVKIIGFGVNNGTDYWLVQNSWGTDWGIEGGFFMIKRGVDECDFESMVYTGFPLLK